jgi:hypothetical protein
MDGFGVRGGEEDEIDGYEVLTVDFTPSGVYLKRIELSDIFREAGTTEAGTLSLDGNPIGGNFYAIQDTGSNGELTLLFEGLHVSYIDFYIPRDFFTNLPADGYEYSVKGVEVIPNPEPGTLLLLGLGLAGLGVYNKKFRKK